MIIYINMSLSHFQCKHVSGLGFHRGSYQCKCQPEFYHPSQNNLYTSTQPFTELFYKGIEVELAYNHRLLNQSDSLDFVCRPCAPGCVNCTENTPCKVEYDVMIRGIPLGIQSFCMTISVVLAMIIIHLRTKKVRKKHIKFECGR